MKFKAGKKYKPVCKVANGTAIAVIGDVHGQLHLFQNILSQIDDAFDQLNLTKNIIVQVGDLIDRGEDSIACMDLAIQRKFCEKSNFIALMGNHEQILRLCLRSNEDCTKYISGWMSNGGRATLDDLLGLEKYNDTAEIMNSPALFREDLRNALGDCRRDYLDDLKSHYLNEELIVTHAGITSALGVEDTLKMPWDDQSSHHWAWTRKPADNGLIYCNKKVFLIHGHTVNNVIIQRKHRLEIDSGACCYGILSAAIFTNNDMMIVQSVDQN